MQVTLIVRGAGLLVRNQSLVSCCQFGAEVAENFIDSGSIPLEKVGLLKQNGQPKGGPMPEKRNNIEKKACSSTTHVLSGFEAGP